MKRNDSGYILPMTLVAITLMAFAALLTGRTFGVQLRASIQERLIIEERLTTRNAEHIIDAWMADPTFSKEIVEGGPGVNGWQELNPLDPTLPTVPVWRTPDGSQPCSPPADTVCWKFTVTDPTADNPKLRGREAEQDITDITTEIRSGCVGDIDRCQRTTEITRSYERAVFAHYQLHYENDTAPDTAFNGPTFNRPDGIRDPAACETPPVPAGTVCDDPPEAQLRGLRVVFTSADKLNGPLRYSGDDGVLYCGSPQFKRIETKGNLPRPANDATCLLKPRWLSAPAQWPTTNAELRADQRFEEKDDDLELPDLSLLTPPTGTTLSSVNYDFHYPGTGDAINDGDIIISAGSATIERLVVEGSVTVYAEGDIIICGDIEASDTNPAGGPNVIALITQGDVILNPSGSTPPKCADDTLAELNASHSLTLTNVAILAPEGAVYARRWHLPHAASGGPTLLTIEGSIAAQHLGLYGIPDPATGDVTHGWSKDFTYPTDSGVPAHRGGRGMTLTRSPSGNRRRRGHPASRDRKTVGVQRPASPGALLVDVSLVLVYLC